MKAAPPSSKSGPHGSRAADMADGSPILMPKLGLTMAEGVLASWAVQVGTRVRAGDILFVVETDKIATEVEARGDGEILSLDVAEGETVPVGAVLGRWTGPSLDNGDAAAQPDVADAGPSPEPPAPQHPRAAAGGRVRATPLARRLATREGVDLAQVTGSGPGGRIKAADVTRALDMGTPHDRGADEAPAPLQDAGQRRAATRMEQVIARRLALSKQTIPHFYAFADVDITDLMLLRGKLNADADAGPRLSLTHLLAAGLARALAAMPQLNARWEDGEIVSFADIDIGIAVDNPRGLMVPIVRRADQLTIDALAGAINGLVEKARAGTLEASDMQGGTISISNVGMFGASALIPIIDPGQSAILGVGKPKPVFRPDAQGQPELRQELMLVLSCDHRIYNGVLAAMLLDEMTRYLENPLRLLRG